MRAYQEQHDRVMLARSARRHLFSQLVGEHAIHVCELARAESANSKKGLMATWLNIERLGLEWAHLVSCNDHKDSEFAKGSEQVIRRFSETLADYILDGTEPPQQLGGVCAFFDAIGENSSGAHWNTYTSAVVHMVDAMRRYGKDSEAYHGYAAECIKRGAMLGQWLDCTMRRRNEGVNQLGF